MVDNIPFYKPPMTKAEAKAVYNTVLGGWLTFGSKTEEFEKRFARYINAPYCVMTNSCTNALNLAVAYWKKKNPNVSFINVPSLTCAATALAVLWNGIDIEFGDLAKDESFSMDETFNPSIPVHYAGKYNKQPYPIVEDSAHRILPNSFTGITTCFSFYVTKNITTGEGGMIACNDKYEYEWYKKARLYGIDKNVFQREKMFQTGEKPWEFQSEFIGYKCNPTDINASIGLVQLGRIDKLNEKRKKVADWYNKKLKLNYDREAWHLYPILVEKRDDFMLFMKGYKVSCSVHFYPLHRQEAFKLYVRHSLPVTDWVYDRIVSLPFYPNMTKQEVDIVSNLVLRWEGQHGKCSVQLIR